MAGTTGAWWGLGSWRRPEGKPLGRVEPWDRAEQSTGFEGFPSTWLGKATVG